MKKESDVIIRNLDSEEMAYHQAQLKKYGYTRILNAFWTEIWEKNGWEVQLERA